MRRGDLKARGHEIPLERLLREGRCATNIKNRLLKAGLLAEQRSECGLREWRGKKLVIQIDHINGIHSDNRLENLRMLCPNCHSQKETFGTRKLEEKSSQLSHN